MEPANKSTQHLAEGILTEILARLPLRSIWRFKSVCRRWKSAVESVYFRRLFVSLHQNSSCCWSLYEEEEGEEVLNLHGCETWGLPKSLVSYFREMVTCGGPLYGGYLGASNSSGLVWVQGSNGDTYVGNPVLQQWVIIPLLPYRYSCLPFGLVTRTDKDGVVLGFKVVKLAGSGPMSQSSGTLLCLCVYSSETGIWTRKRLHCPRDFTPNPRRPMDLNGTLYFHQTSFDEESEAIFAHDFYGESDHCRVILLPDHNPDHNRDFKRALTASSGFVMYIKTFLSLNGDNLLKVWRLNNDDSWQLLWEIRLQFDIRYYAPITMHPFDCNLVYLWSQENRYLVSLNLKTQNYKSLTDDNHQGFSLNQTVFERYMDNTFRSNWSVSEYGSPVTLLQFVFSRWMESMPCPPQVEMMDTTSLLAYTSSLPKQYTGAT